MNKTVTKLFSCCINNRVIAIDTNFKHFMEQFKEKEKDAYSARWFFNKFKENRSFEYKLGKKIYYFQRLV